MERTLSFVDAWSCMPNGENTLCFMHHNSFIGALRAAARAQSLMLPQWGRVVVEGTDRPHRYAANASVLSDTSGRRPCNGNLQK